MEFFFKIKTYIKASREFLLQIKSNKACGSISRNLNFTAQLKSVGTFMEAAFIGMFCVCFSFTALKTHSSVAECKSLLFIYFGTNWVF